MAQFTCRSRMFVIVALFAALPHAARAGVFSMPAGLTSLQTVTVGNAGNAPDTRYNGVAVGGVSYTYQIGKFEVTAGQYCEFLNAVAKADPYGLYNESMDTAVNSYGCNIQRGGSAGSYTYTVAADWANRPVNFVSYWDACRFANWMNHGQQTGAQDAATTEDGSYTLNGYTGSDGATIQRNAGARWVVPSEDEWYKAAYHKNDGVTSNYWNYPIRKDFPPSNTLGNPTDPGNNATYYSGGYTIGSPYYRTEAGDHENSASPYGTFDQGGNVWEWNEATGYRPSYRNQRGGAFGSYAGDLQASFRALFSVPSYEGYTVGFRVVEVPEPTTMTVLALGGFAILKRRAGHRPARSGPALSRRRCVCP